MDSTLLTAVAAAVGSVVGGTASICTTWITQRSQANRARVEANLRERESLYGEFITEASRLAVEALSHSLEKPETFVKLYGILGRIRLVASDQLLGAGEECCRQIIELYARPNMTMDQIRQALQRDRLDPLKEFSTICRAELLELSSHAA